MNFKACFVRLIVTYPLIISFVSILLSIITMSLPFSVDKMSFPSFEDPQMGFLTRGTTLAKRFNTWQKLQEEVRPSGTLTKNPAGYLLMFRKNKSTPLREFKSNRGKREMKTHKMEQPLTIKYITIMDQIDPIHKKTKSRTNVTLKSLFGSLHNEWNPSEEPKYIRPKPYDRFFCGNPDKKYAHLIVSNDGENLYTLNNIQLLCELENSLMNLPSIPDVCIANDYIKSMRGLEGTCCKPWSLVNYIAALNNKDSCDNITQEDLDVTRRMLVQCSKYFLLDSLTWGCSARGTCPDTDCLKNEIIFDIFFYVAGPSFLPRDTLNGDIGKLEETVIFLPVSAGIGTRQLYDELLELEPALPIVAIHFDIKSLIFDHYLLRDLRLVAGSLTFIFICLWSYVKSFFLTVAAQLVIVFTLAIDYFFYVGILEIHTFPFMNLLTVILCVGIGADQTFIFWEVWEKNKLDPINQNDLTLILSKTYDHTFDAISTSTITTAVAFWGTSTSNVMAIRCFSIFAGTAVILNFFLIVVWFPSMVIIYERYLASSLVWGDCWGRHLDRFRSYMIESTVFSETWHRLATVWKVKKDVTVKMVFDYKRFWFAFLTVVGLISCFIIFIYPKLRLSTALDFQLLMSRHLFEKYDFEYKNKFYFNKGDLDEYELEYTLPLRFVWGLKPVDNGRFFNPSDLGYLEYDDSFDMGHPDSQRWLREFCFHLRDQPFYLPSVGISLTNCFIETLVTTMNTKCDHIPFVNTRPCCDGPVFPYERTLFNYCLIKEMADIYDGPVQLTYPKTAGVFFSKEKLKDDISDIKVVVVEYESNMPYRSSFETIRKFYNTVEAWMKNVSATAPVTIRNGFFVSDSEFYDLQNELTAGTEVTLLTSLALASSVLFICTLNPVISFFAVITIGFSITVTVAILVLMGWTLNILESVIISTAIGLAIDFSLHYCINYRIGPPNTGAGGQESARFALSYFMGPSFMAGLTTAVAGFFMMFSIVLPYFQIGIFMFLIMVVSWIYATFYLGSLFALFGEVQDRYQYSYRRILRSITGEIDTEPLPPVSYHDPLGIPGGSQDPERISIIRCESPKLEPPSYDESAFHYTIDTTGSPSVRIISGGNNESA